MYALFYPDWAPTLWVILLALVFAGALCRALIRFLMSPAKRQVHYRLGVTRIVTILASFGTLIWAFSPAGIHGMIVAVITASAISIVVVAARGKDLSRLAFVGVLGIGFARVGLNCAARIVRGQYEDLAFTGALVAVFLGGGIASFACDLIDKSLARAPLQQVTDSVNARVSAGDKAT